MALTKLAVAAVAAANLILAAGPGDMKPNYSYLPFTSTLRNLVQGMQGVGVILAVLALVIGAICYAMSKASGSQGGAHASVTGMVIAVLAGAIIAGAGTLIAWATGLPLVPGA